MSVVFIELENPSRICHNNTAHTTRRVYNGSAVLPIRVAGSLVTGQVRVHAHMPNTPSPADSANIREASSLSVNWQTKLPRQYIVQGYGVPNHITQIICT